MDFEIKSRDAVKPPVMIIYGPSGCKTGDTLIHYRRGKRNSSRTHTLKDFVAKFNGEVSGKGAKDWRKKPTYVQSFDETSKTIVYNLVEGAYYTGVKEVIKVTTDNSGIVKITTDDSVLLEDGTFKTVSELVIGDKLLCKGSNLLTKNGNGGRKTKSEKRVVVEGMKYYEGGWDKYVTCNGITYHYKRNHRARLVVEADMNGVTYDMYLTALKTDPNHTYRNIIPSDMEVHHKDENVSNDDLNNLEVLTSAEHLNHHISQSINNFNRQSTIVSTIVALDNLGQLDVYDLTMAAPNHNIVCNDGIIVHNTGKTTIASQAEDNVFIPTEDGAGELRLNTLKDGVFKDYDEVIAALRYVYANADRIKTLVIDSIDHLEPIVWDYVCRSQNPAWDSIESPGYGRGYIECDKAWMRIISAILKLRDDKQVTVILLAHDVVRTVNDPMTGPYDAHELKLHKRAVALWKENVDMIGLIKNAVAVDSKTGKGKGGTAPTMFTRPNAAYTAKTRYKQMPSMIQIGIDDGWSEITKYIPYFNKQEND